jgi:hypothetical protein
LALAEITGDFAFRRPDAHRGSVDRFRLEPPLRNHLPIPSAHWSPPRASATGRFTEPAAPRADEPRADESPRCSVRNRESGPGGTLTPVCDVRVAGR